MKTRHCVLMLLATLLVLSLASCKQEKNASEDSSFEAASQKEVSISSTMESLEESSATELTTPEKEPSIAIVQFDGEKSNIIYPKLSNPALLHYPVRISGNHVIGLGLYDVGGIYQRFFYIYDYEREQYMSAISGYYLPDQRFAMSGDTQESRADDQIPLPFDSSYTPPFEYTIYNKDFSKADVQIQFDFVPQSNGNYKYTACGFGYSPVTDEYFMLYIQREAPPEEDNLKIAWFNSAGEQTGTILSVPKEDFNFGKTGQIYAHDPVISLDDSLFLLEPFINNKIMILNAVDKTYKIYEEAEDFNDPYEWEKDRNIEYIGDFNDVLAPYEIQKVANGFPMDYIKRASRPPFDIIPAENSDEVAISYNETQQIIATLPYNFYLSDWQYDDVGGFTAVFEVYERVSVYDGWITDGYQQALLGNQPWDYRSEGLGKSEA